MSIGKVRVGVGIMLLKGGKVLLGRRHSDPSKADSEVHGEGTWTMPGGKPDFGESLADCACREVREETGIVVEPGSLRCISVADDIVSDAHFATVGFLAEQFKGEARVMEPDEIVEWKWFPLDDLPEPIYFPSERMLKNFKEDVLYRRSF